ncbi:MAG: hypothetical protein Q8M02_03690, partial [Candidatus Didemnitutus sp.]|nr:hypothetical protein [Candidatus Didemnitutus sp.]
MSLPNVPAGQLPLFHVVGFTGHRLLTDPAGTAQAIAHVLTELEQEAAGEWIGLSSVAAGADQLFVEAALARNFGWEALLPLPLVDFERDFSADEWPA